MLNYDDGIIFDLDGTIFQTDKLIVHVFNCTFEKLILEGYNIERIPNKREILALVGLTLDNIWNRLLPNYGEEVHNKASEYLLMYEIEGIRNGDGSLYPEVEETLIKLADKGYKLFIASNGLKEYVHEVIEYYSLTHLFEGIYSSRDFNTNSKSELLGQILTHHNFNKGVMVGDRLSDFEAGVNNKLYVIGCNFGFSEQNELNNADIVINEFKQIYKVIIDNSFWEGVSHE